jgi:predicted dehydrogenase
VKPIRIAIVGAGHMGQSHADKVVELALEDGSVASAGVADTVHERARRAATRNATRAVRDGRALFADADAAVIAVPTSEHFVLVRDALDAGLDVLVEKPIAATLEEAEALIAQARSSGRVLQVGHQEWYNPALRVIRERVRAPRFVEGHRLGPFTERATDVDVVRDLMIHDLDILQQLLGEEPDRVEAIGVSVMTDTVDIANARLAFPGGCVANLTASRVSTVPVRRLRLFERDACFDVDFLERSAAIARRSEASPGTDSATHDVEVEELKTEAEDTLLAQLRAFVVAVGERRLPDPSTVGALRTALRVVAAMPSIDSLG